MQNGGGIGKVAPYSAFAIFRNVFIGFPLWLTILTRRVDAHIIITETGDEEDTMAENHPAERDALAESVSEKDRHHRFGAADEESDVCRALRGESWPRMAASRVEPRADVSSRNRDETFFVLEWRVESEE